MQTFAYERPTLLAEAVQLLTRHGDRARILAGGTDLVVGLRHASVRPALVVDIKGLTDLPAPVTDLGGVLRIGATAVMADLAGDPRIRAAFPALVEAMDVVGSIQIRNRATLVGNVCNASPAADTAPALLVHDATVLITGPAGERRLPLDQFVLGPRSLALDPGELVTALDLPVPEEPLGTAFSRMTRRRGVDLATVNLCCSVRQGGPARIAFGAAAPRPFLVVDDTGALADPSATPAARDKALARLVSRASPISDVRAGREYRAAMLTVLSRRALATAHARLAALTTSNGHRTPGGTP
jgi:CO/xanthine dehydrogenase FAD-binding subunit